MGAGGGGGWWCDLIGGAHEGEEVSVRLSCCLSVSVCVEMWRCVCACTCEKERRVCVSLNQYLTQSVSLSALLYFSHSALIQPPTHNSSIHPLTPSSSPITITSHRYGIKEEELRPYFALPNVLEVSAFDCTC